MRAWVTLLTQPGYLIGVRALGASLRRAGSPYPLVVMVTGSIDAASRRLLADEGCLLREVAPIRPTHSLRDSYANARFAEVWTKLAVWRLTEFERVVFLDADMVVTQNMDELFDVELGADEIAACHACRCNPNRIPSYPASWTPANCAYTQDGDDLGEPGSVVVDDYLNAGLLVLRPDEQVFVDLMSQLDQVADLSTYPFAEQDFLNERFHRRWRPLPYVYNALKTLPFQHPALWDATAVKNIHYIIDKPWQKARDPEDRYHDLDRIWWDVADTLLEPAEQDDVDSLV